MALKFLVGRVAVSAVLLGIGFAQACGGESDDPPVQGSSSMPPVYTGPFPQGGEAGQTNGSGEAGAAASSGETGAGGSGPLNEPGSPVVEIISPPAVSDPNDGDVLVAAELEVVCSAKKSPEEGSLDVDPSGVEIDVLDAEGEVVGTTRAGSTRTPDEFSALVRLMDVSDNGGIGFRCRARDFSTPALVGADTITSFIDHGPRIAVRDPGIDSIQPRKSLNFVFTVDPDPVAEGDEGAEVENVVVTVGGTEFEPDVSDDGEYILPVDLEDPALFPNTPNGVLPVTISATNSRAERILSYSFIVDGEGPEISIEHPESGDVVGRQQRIEFTVKDEFSPINPGSIVVVVNTTEIHYEAGSVSWTRTSIDATTEAYTFDLDASRIEESEWQARLTVRASDAVDNASLTRNVLVYLDYVAPMIDLDPPNIRVLRDESGSTPDKCSVSFDPVGFKALNDMGSLPGTAVRFRAVVWERSNDFGQEIIHLSTLDPSTVQLFISPDPAVPLLVDTNDDGVCDDIGEGLPDAVDMLPIKPSGSAWFGQDDPGGPPALVGCELANEAVPQALCTENVSDLTIALGHTMTGRPPVIFAPGVIENSLECTGSELELSTIVSGEGWFCAAVRALDFADNRGVSRPLRGCWNDPATDANPCTEEPAPSCVADCAPPPRVAWGDNIIEQ
jgi:hypothetical protein